MINLGGTYRHFLHARDGSQQAEEPAIEMLQKSVSLLERVHVVSRRAVGDDHPVTVTAMGDLAMVYVDLERLKDAKPLMEAVLEWKERMLGPEHPQTEAARKDLTRLLVDMGELVLTSPVSF